MSDKKTHRFVEKPQISARHLADYMAASERAKRSILRKCKYPKITQIIQHDHAKSAISQFLCGDGASTDTLTARAAQLRDMMADSDFRRDTLDFNADYIDRFVEVVDGVNIPAADRLPAGKPPPISLEEVKITAELHFRLSRIAKGNKVKTGAGMLRYAKGKSLDPETAAWQSAFLLGYLKMTSIDLGAEPERKLCLTVDVHSGIAYPAPGDAVSRFHEMEAACEAIAERWLNIKPPNGAIF